MTRTVSAFAFVLLTILLPIGFPVKAEEATKGPIIGYLSISPGPTRSTDAFRQGLREFGYTEGQSISIEYRFAEGKLDRLSTLAAELVNLRVKLIVATVPVATRAAQDALRRFQLSWQTAAIPLALALWLPLHRPVVM